MMLRCEAAIGIEIFSNLDQASGDMTDALDGLNNARGSADTPSRLSTCQATNADTLDEAGLDGSGIQNAICKAAEPASASSPLTSSNEAQNQSTGTTSATSLNASTTSSVSTSSLEPRPKAGGMENTTNTSASDYPSSGFSSPFINSSSPSSTTSTPGINSTFSETPSSAPTAANNLSVTTLTVVQTTWVVGTPLSFSLPSSNATNATTVTIKTTLPSTVDITTTVTVFDSASTSISGSNSSHGPWAWHGSWLPYPYNPYHHSQGASGWIRPSRPGLSTSSGIASYGSSAYSTLVKASTLTTGTCTEKV